VRFCWILAKTYIIYSLSTNITILHPSKRILMLKCPNETIFFSNHAEELRVILFKVEINAVHESSTDPTRVNLQRVLAR